MCPAHPMPRLHPDRCVRVALMAACACLLLSACAWWPAAPAPRTSVSLTDTEGIPRPPWLREMVAAMDAAAEGAPIRLKLSYELAPAPGRTFAQAGSAGRL